MRICAFLFSVIPIQGKKQDLKLAFGLFEFYFIKTYKDTREHYI